MNIQQLNDVSVDTFIHTFGDIFENSPWIAQKAALARPFVSIESAFEAMKDLVVQSSTEAKTTLILEHPELGRRIHMSDASVAEQAGAGLNALSAQEFEQMSALNERYMAKFQFPFIIAVAGLTKHTIMQEIERRLALDAAIEFDTALQEIYKIARIRFDAVTTQPTSI